ncbi:hypothetical protein BS47DRAFT_1483386 [Hydnum rufescens UP504]|uniref:Glucose receptor Git3 N-terminal domain-containing protein n=1 Tax=Hydnum rufescens UP504 TaxID=1448309 RepID=A0A9P6B3R9_9AGAM|nr:hypothetical protein BS47DRAFT_1483386 [Hydnum rufescens UP504]
MNTNNPNDWNASLKNSFGLRAGILLISEVAVVSFIAATALLLFALYKAIGHYWRYRGWGPEDSALQPVSVLFLCAIFMDKRVIQAVGSILSARWAFDGAVIEGSYCTAQAVLKQFGNNGVAWFTIAIAIMTFLQAIFPGLLSQSQARRLAGAMIIFIFLFVFLMITISSTTISHYYGNTGPWCWIIGNSKESKRLQIGSEYAFYWLAASISAVLYGTIAFKWYREASAERDDRRIRNAMAMGWYPIAYIVEVLPMSIVRFLGQRPGKKPPHGWMILSATLFASAGAVNVFLWLVTGRRFGFSVHDDQEDQSNDPYLLGPYPPAVRDLDSTQRLFPGSTVIVHETHIPRPYELVPLHERGP